MASSSKRLNKIKTIQLLNRIVQSEISSIVNLIMKKFDDEIVAFEDEDDPAKPSRFRDEFAQFLEKTIDENIVIDARTIKRPAGEALSINIDIGVGDDSKLGFGEELDENTTDGLKIIGTIIQGISGRYVLVTSNMTGGPEGRFGKAFILPEDQYRKEALSKGWDLNRPVWSFSNFPGIPGFFKEVEYGKIVANIARKLAEAIK